MSERSLQMVEAHRRAGLLETPEIQLTRSLARIAGESRPEVALATAWALRGPRQGHICVDLAHAHTACPTQHAAGGAHLRPAW